MIANDRPEPACRVECSNGIVRLVDSIEPVRVRDEVIHL